MIWDFSLLILGVLAGVSCFGCVSKSKKEPQNKSTTKFEKDDTVEIAEEIPNDFGTRPKCGVWVDTLLHWKNLERRKIINSLEFDAKCLGFRINHLLNNSSYYILIYLYNMTESINLHTYLTTYRTVLSKIYSCIFYGLYYKSGSFETFRIRNLR